MQTASPPYALEHVEFPFPALAGAASHPLSANDRDMTIATLMVARLMVSILPPVNLPAPERHPRAERAKPWLMTLAMPQPARMALLRAIDASAGAPVEAAAALRELMQVLGGHLAPDATVELGGLAERLSLYYRETP